MSKDKIKTNNCDGSNFTLPAVCCVGILGNITAVLVLLSPSMRTTTFHQSLLFLVICDLLYLVMTLSEPRENTPSHELPTAYRLIYPHLWFPLRNVLITWETLLIMSISTERWLAVCRPLWHRTHSLSYSSRVHLIIYILPSALLAVVINIPKWFELKLIMGNGTDVDLTNFERVNITEIDFTATDLRFDSDYVFYYTHLTRLLCTGIIPFIYLAAINICICVTIRKSSNLQSFSRPGGCNNYTICLHSTHESPDHYRPPRPADIQLRQMVEHQHAATSRQSKKFQDGNQSQPSKVSRNSILTLSIIVILYLVCNAPRLSLNTAEYLIRDRFYQPDVFGCTKVPEWYFILLRFSELFIVVNTSANFLIYFAVCKKFKNVLRSQVQGLRERVLACCSKTFAIN